MIDNWNKEIEDFISAANATNVRMLMVGGGAVNIYGYQRHSSDVDFWIEPTSENLDKLLESLNSMGYELEKFPEAVLKQQQNISLKFSPIAPDVELITRFKVNRSFDEAYLNSVIKIVDNLEWRVLAYDDLITNKIKFGRPKDLLDVQELQRIRKAK